MSCQEKIDNLIDVSKKCQIAPCSFDGVYQPAFGGVFYGRGNSYDIIKAIGVDPSKATIPTLLEQCKHVCSLSYKDWQKVLKKKDAETGCFEALYLYTLITKGFHVPSDHSFYWVDYVDGKKVVWALGKFLEIVDEMNTL